MILFHGTCGKQTVRSIAKSGLLLPDERQWECSLWGNVPMVPPSVFFASTPRGDVGANPLHFAQPSPFLPGRPWDGYLVVVECPVPFIQSHLRGVWRTQDVELYYRTPFEMEAVLDEWRELNGRSDDDPYWGPDDPAVFSFIQERYPELGERCRLTDGRDLACAPEWLWQRRQHSPAPDTHILTGPIPPDFILDIVKVVDGRSGRVVRQFDPKHQPKLKHKHKTFASLVRHHVNGLRRH